jgi:hypothetical protein
MRTDFLSVSKPFNMVYNVNFSLFNCKFKLAGCRGYYAYWNLFFSFKPFSVVDKVNIRLSASEQLNRVDDDVLIGQT